MDGFGELELHVCQFKLYALEVFFGCKCWNDCFKFGEANFHLCVSLCTDERTQILRSLIMHLKIDKLCPNLRIAVTIVTAHA